ncbi:unnamed protein product [Paramecium octaurelia]|uniref:Uncharacterized protein n=1 Tax=Paramecium octaurelia TaxID=43137 RepID=A0A8S1YL79_PAROT|nr:unnamed protein product [Paramecium octaurelia]
MFNISVKFQLQVFLIINQIIIFNETIALFFLLEYSDFAPLPAADANAKFSENDLYALREASIIRGNYKDVASQYNGALLSTARVNTFWTPGIENSPLRNLLYYYPTGPGRLQGHVVAWLGQSIIVQFLQAYQINTVRFWMWDEDNRETDMQVFAIAADRKTENVIFDDIRTKSNVNVVKISDQLVSGLRFYSRGGNNLDHSGTSIIKIQAFYAF